jgi:2-succinyl-5-enolpyruvyl-6-hydroxy-3-cyclohexene-1-carboxylate synthase
VNDADTQATFAATLVDEWVRAGVTDAVVAPGSRSTPITLAFVADGRLRVHVVLDERSAGYVGLGLGLATGRPAVVVTTSGTAAVELHPAVVEADQAGVPLLAVTADRPFELHGVGAPQTIEQAGLFGGSVRWAASPGVADVAATGGWRSLAARAVCEAASGARGPGPVHLNLAFREPLLGSASSPPLPPGRPDGAPWHQVTSGARLAPPASVSSWLSGLAGSRGVVVAGGGAGSAVAVHRLADRLGWPVLADPRSGCRVPSRSTVAAADALLRLKEVAGWVPDVVLRLGDPWASRVMATWLAGLGPEVQQVLVDPYGRWADPDRRAGLVLPADPQSLCWALADGPSSWGEWGERWAAVEAAAQATFDEVLAEHTEVTEPGVARTVATVVPEGGVLFTSSSMPVRDVEWYARPRDGLRVLANRGANGIDGVVSTALGVGLGLGDNPVVALVGDLAFLYDVAGLVGAAERDCACTLVVVDNDGGGIFSFLPQAGAVSTERFEQLWGTPHGLDLTQLAASYGVPVMVAGAADEVGPAVLAAVEAGGVRMVLVRTSRRANVAVHDELNDAVAAAVGRLTV